MINMFFKKTQYQNCTVTFFSSISSICLRWINRAENDNMGFNVYQ